MYNYQCKVSEKYLHDEISELRMPDVDFLAFTKSVQVQVPRPCTPTTITQTNFSLSGGIQRV